MQQLHTDCSQLALTIVGLKLLRHTASIVSHVPIVTCVARLSQTTSPRKTYDRPFVRGGSAGLNTSGPDRVNSASVPYRRQAPASLYLNPPTYTVGTICTVVQRNAPKN